MSAPPTQPALLVDDLVVRFEELEAVGGISFAVAPGEVFGLLGPNGAGKTTTIRVLTTLLAPTSGRALVAGFDVRSDSLAVRACIGYIPQAISVDGALTAYENLDFYGRVTGVPRRERRERIAEAIETMELEHDARPTRAHALGRHAAPARDRQRAAQPPAACCSSTSPPSAWTRTRGDGVGAPAGAARAARARRSSSPPTDGGGRAPLRSPGDHGPGAAGRAGRAGGAASSATAPRAWKRSSPAITGRPIGEEPDEQEGRLSDVRAQRRVARRLG